MTRKKKAVLYPVLFMMGITAVYTLLLALINEASIGRIQNLEALQQKQTILYVMNLEVPSEPSALNEAFNRLIQPEKDYFKAVENGKPLGYAFPVEGAGLWGSISGYAAVDASGTHLLGMDLPIQSETPGLGGRITEPWFKEQFRNIPLAPSGQDSFLFKPAAGGNIDAITGATLTSEAVRKLLNTDTDSFVRNLKKEGSE